MEKIIRYLIFSLHTGFSTVQAPQLKLDCRPLLFSNLLIYNQYISGYDSCIRAVKFHAFCVNSMHFFPNKHSHLLSNFKYNSQTFFKVDKISMYNMIFYHFSCPFPLCKSFFIIHFLCSTHTLLLF